MLVAFVCCILPSTTSFGLHIKDDGRSVLLLQHLLQRFFGNQQCLLYVSGSYHSSSVVEVALMQAEIPVYRMKKAQLQSYCKYFLLSTNKEDAIDETRHFGTSMVVYQGLKLKKFCRNQVLMVHLIEVGKLKLCWNQKEILVESLLQIYNLVLRRREPRLEKPSDMKKTFELSTYSCHPYVFYDEGKKSCSGVEYQMINGILKGHSIVCRFVNSSETNNIHPARLAIDRVVKNESDLAAGGFWQLGLIGASNVSITDAVEQTCFNILVPKPKLLSEFSYVFQPLQLHLWLMIAVFMFLGSKLMQFVSKLNFRGVKKGRIVYDDFFKSFLQTIQLFTFGCVTHRPTLKQLSLCCIFSSFSLTFLFISTVYAAGFSSILT